MKIAFVSSEVHPFSKTGGLADISYSLPHALNELDCEVTVYSPYYLQTAEMCRELGLKLESSSLPNSLWIGNDQHQVNFLETSWQGVRLIFVVNESFYRRESLYTNPLGRDYQDNLSRYSFFCRAVLEYCLLTGEIPDVFHANDWQTGLLPVYLRTSYNLVEFSGCRSVFSIHNMGYQGIFSAEEIYATGLDWTVFTPDMLEYYGNLNLLKGGIVFADMVSTVSPSYSREIQTEEYGMGLDGVTSFWKSKLHGILNGISTDQWNPETDPYIAANYSADNLKGKSACKSDLQSEFNLPISKKAFLLGIVSRLDVQKGIDLILAAFHSFADLDIQLVLVGKGNPELEQQITELASQYPRMVSYKFAYSEELAHKVEAGADAFLMPSAYEPCGLNQMYSMRYGTIPIVRETGGLKDTVINYTPRRLESGKATGFTFRQFEVRKLIESVKKAASLCFNEPSSWRKLVEICMKQDLSWSKSASHYLELYQDTLNQPKVGLPGKSNV